MLPKRPRDATLALVARLSRAIGELKAPRSNEWATETETETATVFFPFAKETAAEEEGGAEVFAEQDGTPG